MIQERAAESGLLLVLWSFFSLCMTGVSILFYTKMHRQLFKLFRVFLLSPITFLVVQFSVSVLCLNEVLRACVSVLLWIRYRGKAALVKDGSDAVWEFKGKGSTRMILVPAILSQKAVLFEHSVAGELEKRLFEGGKTDSGYQKLKSVVFSFCGFVATREVNDFNVRNHVRTLRRNEVYTEEDMTELLSEFCHDMDFDKPQWEILIIRRFLDKTDEVEKSALIFRFHHSYLDGISMLMMLNKLSDDYTYKLNPLTTGLPKWKMALHYANALIFGSLQLYQIAINRLRTQWKTNPSLSTGNKIFVWSRNQFSLETLQKIRAESRASIANILGLAFAESCRRVLPKDRLVENVQIAEVMALLPYPNTKPQNRFTMFSYSADVSPDFIAVFSLNERLKALKEEAHDSIMGPQPLVAYYFLKLIGRLPKIFFRIFLGGTHDSLYLSSAPCSREKFTLFQGQCDAVGAFQPCFSETGIILSTVAYEKWINVCLGVDASWLLRDEALSVVETMSKVIDELLEAATPVQVKPVVQVFNDAPTSLPNVPEEEEIKQDAFGSKTSVSDSSDHGIHSQESLTDSVKDDENQNQAKKKKVRSRNKPKVNTASTGRKRSV